MKKIKLTFEKGGSLTVTPLADMADTTECITGIMPCDSKLVHTRYCGREICFPIATMVKPPKDNLTCLANKFDVAYWRNWESPADGLPGSPGAETISFYYGPEKLNFQTQPIYVSVFGRIDPREEAILDEVGNRVWQCGFEDVHVELIDAE